jgi:hypothetical protein
MQVIVAAFCVPSNTLCLPALPTIVTLFIRVFFKSCQDNWDAAVELFQQLKSNQLGVRPNSVTYNILMSACLTRDRPQNVSCFLQVGAAQHSYPLLQHNTVCAQMS